MEYQIVENQSNILSMKPANMIFTRDNGKYCGTDIIKYPYKIIHNELWIENCRFYDLRGSYATTILRNGVEIRDVADILGHKNIETTENYYISSSDEFRKEANDIFEKVIHSDIIDKILNYKYWYTNYRKASQKKRVKIFRNKNTDKNENFSNKHLTLW